ncbi:MAG: ShlB/FhaC/HecB family hemolysin secretion/activation protein [Candidatus Omnitrophica bacterium]|nr:ShlB/FhaC/HecB family hemolysin secretion/activation protein [Candidatus Omnitrophota bacterium]
MMLRSTGTIKSILCSFTWALFLFMVLAAPCAHPQQDTTDRDTSEVDKGIFEQVSQKLQPKPETTPEIKDVPDAKPEGKEVFISRIVIEGVESFAPETFIPIIQPFENRNLTKPELDSISKKIQREYLKRGVIAACFIPPQDIKDGVLKLKVIESRYGELMVQEHKFFDPELLNRYWTLKTGEILRYDKLSRNMQLLNSNPDRKVKASLQAGKQPGTTDIVLSAETKFPVHLTGSFDREGNPTTGKERKGIGLRHNNFLSAGDTLITGYNYGSYFSNIYAYHKVPITNTGTSVMYGYAYSKSAPKKDQQPLGLSSTSKTSSVFLYQPYFYSKQYLGQLQAGMEFKDKNVKRNRIGVYSNDRLRVLKGGGNIGTTLFKGALNIAPILSQGINGFGAHRKTRLSSRVSSVNNGIENTFTKVNMNIDYMLPLEENMRLVLRSRSQLSDRKLGSQEEFSLGGLDSVRGYPPSDFLADDAFLTNLELQVPFSFLPKEIKFPYGERPISEEIVGILFWDYAHGERKGELNSQLRAGSKRDVDLSSIGTGIRVRVANQALLRLEYGHPIGFQRMISESGVDKVHFSVEFEDQFPQELERLKEIIDKEKTRKLAKKILDDLSLEHEKLRQLPQEALLAQIIKYIDGVNQKVPEMKKYENLAQEYYAKADYDQSLGMIKHLIHDSRLESMRLVTGDPELKDIRIKREVFAEAIPAYKKIILKMREEAEKKKEDIEFRIKFPEINKAMDDHYSKGEELLKNGKYSEALSEMKNALAAYDSPGVSKYIKER